MRVVRQALAIALLFDTQQDLDVLAVLIAAGLLVSLHPRLEFVLPQRRVLRRLLLRSGALRGGNEKQDRRWYERFRFGRETTGLRTQSLSVLCSVSLPLLWRTFWTLLGRPASQSKDTQNM